MALGQGMGVESVPLLGRLIQKGRSRLRAWLQHLPSLVIRKELVAWGQEASGCCSQRILPPGVLLDHLCNCVMALSDIISFRI